ncbi:hypothetical protein ACLK19_15115 [Escherichia coli]
MNMLALTIILPLIGFVLLAFSRGRSSKRFGNRRRWLCGPGGAGDRLIGVDLSLTASSHTASRCGRGCR